MSGIKFCESRVCWPRNVYAFKVVFDNLLGLILGEPGLLET